MVLVTALHMAIKYMKFINPLVLRRITPALIIAGDSEISFFFGESALSKNGAQAHLFGLLLSLDRKMDVSLLYRNYDKKYQCLNCNAFGESSKSQAEQGFILA